MYQNGEVASMAVKRKATISKFDPSTAHFALDIFHLLPDDLLLEITHTYDIDIGDTHSSRRQIVHDERIRRFRGHKLGNIRGRGELG